MRNLLLILVLSLASMTALAADTKEAPAEFEALVQIARTPIVEGNAGMQDLICNTRVTVKVDDTRDGDYSLSGTEVVCPTEFQGLKINVIVDLGAMVMSDTFNEQQQDVLYFSSLMGFKTDDNQSPVLVSPDEMHFAARPGKRLQFPYRANTKTADLGLQSVSQPLEPAHLLNLIGCQAQPRSCEQNASGQECDSADSYDKAVAQFCRSWGDFYRASVVWTRK